MPMTGVIVPLLTALPIAPATQENSIIRNEPWCRHRVCSSLTWPTTVTGDDPGNQVISVSSGVLEHNQVTSCDDMMINRITAVGSFEGGTTKAVTRRGLVRSGLCSFLCTPGLVVTARLPLVRGSSRRPRAPPLRAPRPARNRCWRATGPAAVSGPPLLPRRRSPGSGGPAPARCTRSRSSRPAARPPQPAVRRRLPPGSPTPRGLPLPGHHAVPRALSANGS